MKLGVKLALVILPLLVLSLVALGGWSYHSAQESIRDAMRMYLAVNLNGFLEAEVFHRQKMLERHELSGFPSFLEQYKRDAMEAAAQRAAQGAGGFLILDEEGREVFCADGWSKEISHEQHEQIFQVLKAAGESREVIHLEGAGGESGALVLGQHYAPWGWYVAFHLGDERMAASLAELRNLTLAMVVGCGVAVLLAISYFSRRFLLQPVGALEEAAQQIAERRPMEKIPVHSGDELDRLARSLESMAGDLQAFHTRQQDWNAELERQVGSRTEELETANLALEDNQATYRSLVESTNTVPWKMDLSTGVFTYMGAQVEAILGYPAESWTDLEAWKARIHPEDREEAISYCIACAGQGEDHDFEYRAVAEDGGVVWIRDVVTVVMYDGEPVELVGFMFDVSESKAREEALQLATKKALEADQAKSDFLAVMSHEIRTPLNGVLGMAELIAETGASGKQKRYCDVMVQSGNALLGIVNDILDFSKIEAGRIELETIDFDLIQGLRDMEALFTEIAHRKGLSFELVLMEGTPAHVRGDMGRLRQVLINLASNAVKFTERGGVRLVVAPEVRDGRDDWICFQVHDTGIGLEEEKLEHLFEAFTQADSSTTRKFGGTGLGLSITQGLVELMGGEIRGENRRPGDGGGAVFIVELPFNAARSIPQAGAVAPKEAAGKPPKNVRLLVVEDDQVNQQVLSGMLKAEKISHEVAENGQKGLELLNREAFDLVLMDCQMPVMDGFEATRVYRAGEGQVPIIALTAYALKGDREKCLAAGMDDYLPKPVRKADLMAKIARWAAA